MENTSNLKEIELKPYSFYRENLKKGEDGNLVKNGQNFYLSGEALRVNEAITSPASFTGINKLKDNPTPNGIDYISMRIERHYINEEVRRYMTPYVSISYQGTSAFIRVQWEYLDKDKNYKDQLEEILLKLTLGNHFQIPLSRTRSSDNKEYPCDQTVLERVTNLNTFYKKILKQIDIHQIEIMFSFTRNPFSDICTRDLISYGFHNYKGTIYSNDNKYKKNRGTTKSTVKFYDKGLKEGLDSLSYRLEFIIQRKVKLWKKHLTWESLDTDFEGYFKSIERDIKKRLNSQTINLNHFLDILDDDSLLLDVCSYIPTKFIKPLESTLDVCKEIGEEKGGYNYINNLMDIINHFLCFKPKKRTSQLDVGFKNVISLNRKSITPYCYMFP